MDRLTRALFGAVTAMMVLSLALLILAHRGDASMRDLNGEIPVARIDVR